MGVEKKPCKPKIPPPPITFLMVRPFIEYIRHISLIVTLQKSIFDILPSSISFQKTKKVTQNTYIDGHFQRYPLGGPPEGNPPVVNPKEAIPLMCPTFTNSIHIVSPRIDQEKKSPFVRLNKTLKISRF